MGDLEVGGVNMKLRFGGEESACQITLSAPRPRHAVLSKGSKDLGKGWGMP